MWQSGLNAACQAAVGRQLRQLSEGCLTLLIGEQSLSFGDKAAALRATIRVHDPRFFRRIALGGGLGAAESLMDGDWVCNDLVSLIRIFIRNSRVATGFDRNWSWVTQFVARLERWWNSNTVANARQNIRQHYDLGNDFFELFLDETLSYSCAWFEAGSASLHEASVAKLERVCGKLDLRPEDHLLEIGTGWGGLALHAAERYGCRVTSTTISAEQHALASQRVCEAGLSHQVTIEKLDYRRLQGTYNKLVSIEMIEAVGAAYIDTYFHQCSRLLQPDGAMLLQGIVIRDQVFERHRHSVDFIGKYIFPGGFLPSIGCIADSVARCTDLRICQLEEMSPHYVLTLRAWREQFWSNIEAVRTLGFDDRFIRMWDYYFQYCEAAFAERQVNVVQIVLGKPEYRGPRAAVPALENMESRVHHRHTDATCGAAL
jgi:cyclopropane-fatty-acyl-phospholipid synthase